jgi:hypothetical protein
VDGGSRWWPRMRLNDGRGRDNGDAIYLPPLLEQSRRCRMEGSGERSTDAGAQSNDGWLGRLDLAS